MLNRSRPQKINQVAPGQPISASHYNMLVDSINQLMDIVGNQGEKHQSIIRMFDADEDITGYEQDATGNHMQMDTSVSTGSDPIKDWNLNEDFVCEIQNSVHLTGERLAGYWDRSSGKRLLLPFMNWHIAKLTATLTAGGSATATIWKMGASVEEASTATITVYDWVLGDNGTAKLPSGTQVIVMPHRSSRRWYAVSVMPMKMFGRATYGSALATSNASITGTLTNQWGWGQDHTDTSITLHNLLVSGSTYEFFGSSGDACLVYYRGYDDDWQIVQPIC